MAHLLKVESAIHSSQGGCEKTPHERHIMLVDRLKLRNELSLVGIDVGRVLLVDELLGLLVDCKLNDSLELFSPDFLTLDIQEVLDVLDRSLQSDKVVFKLLKLLSELSKRSLATLHFQSFLVLFDLFFIGHDLSCLTGLRLKDELFVQDLCQLPAKLIPEAHNEHFLRIELDHTH